MSPVSLDQRLARHTQRSADHDCWIWTSTCWTTKRGDKYPVLTVTLVVGGPSKWRSLSKIVLERKLGRKLLPGMQANHTCDQVNGPCINPDHLYEGTQQQNVQDCIERNRRGNLRGELNPAAKCTNARVKEIREKFEVAYREGSSRVLVYKELALEYGYTWKYIRAIVTRTTFAEVE